MHKFNKSRHSFIISDMNHLDDLPKSRKYSKYYHIDIAVLG